MKSITHYSLRAQLSVLLGGALVLAILSFLPDNRGAIVSSEVRFAEPSSQGLGIVPASCETNGPSAYHFLLEPSDDSLGYKSHPDGRSAGSYAPYAGIYVCVINNGSNTYFIPARSYGELDSFKAASPGIGGLGVN